MLRRCFHRIRLCFCIAPDVTFILGFSPISSLTPALWQPGAIHNGTPTFLMNGILLDFPPLFLLCTIENNTQTSLIFSHKAPDRGFSRSKNHLSDPCTNGSGSGLKIEGGKRVGVSQSDNDIPETQRWTLETPFKLLRLNWKGLCIDWEVQ